MPLEPSVTSASERPRLCTLRYPSALLPKSFERPGPKSVSPATYCSAVKLVVWWSRIVDMCAPSIRRCHTVDCLRFYEIHQSPSAAIATTSSTPVVEEASSERTAVTKILYHVHLFPYSVKT